MQVTIKILKNSEEIELAEAKKARTIENGDEILLKAEEFEIPKAKYYRSKLHFRPKDVRRYYIDPESNEKDFIMIMNDGGHYRCQYNDVVINVLNTLIKYAD